ncbi:MAG: magnesium and cobalt transport protein CorA [Actinomycetota bacterium]
MIVDQAIYRDGRRLPCGDLSDELAMLRDEGHGFIWIGLKDPTDTEFALVNDELKLHPLAVEDAVKGNQRPKLDIYDGTIFVSLKTLRYIEATSDVETGEVMIFVGDRFVVTVRRGEANPLASVRARLEHAPEHLAHGPVAVLYSVMDSIVDNYTLIDAELNVDLDLIEQQVFSGARGVDASEIYRLKREVLEVKRAASPLGLPLRRLRSEDMPIMNEQARPFFGDISDHLLRVIDHVESYDRLLTDVLSAHLAQISVQQNDDMRKISAWVAMAAVPTMVAGIYGMNFHNIPELEASFHTGGHEVYYGYFVVLALMGVVVLGLYRAFRKSGWL